LSLQQICYYSQRTIAGGLRSFASLHSPKQDSEVPPGFTLVSTGSGGRHNALWRCGEIGRVPYGELHLVSSPLEKTVQQGIFAEAHMISQLRRLMTQIFPPGYAKTRHIKRLKAYSTRSAI
jgi:hypothetical protein